MCIYALLLILDDPPPCLGPLVYDAMSIVLPYVRHRFCPTLTSLSYIALRPALPCLPPHHIYTLQVLILHGEVR